MGLVSKNFPNRFLGGKIAAAKSVDVHGTATRASRGACQRLKVSQKILGIIRERIQVGSLYYQEQWSYFQDSVPTVGSAYCANFYALDDRGNTELQIKGPGPGISHVNFTGSVNTNCGADASRCNLREQYR